MRYYISNVVVFFVLFLNIIFAGPALAGQADDSHKALKDFLLTLIDDGYDILNDENLSESQRTNEVKKLLKEHLNLPWMSKYVLGRNRRTLKPNKIEEFTKIYSDFVINSYAGLTSNYSGQKVQIRNIRNIDDNVYIVKTIVTTPGSGSPAHVEYLIHEVSNRQFKVSDVITEGVSLLRSQQAEFGTMIVNNGVDALILELKNKNSLYINTNSGIGR